MGNPKAFLTIPRQEAGYRPVHDRISDYGEVEQTLNTSERKLQASRCMDCGVPFCHWACPLGNRPPEFQDALYKGKWREAYEILTATNDFPEFTGRICPALCEKSCVLKLAIDAPVTIREDEAAIIEAAFREGYVQPHKYGRNGMKVGIVGSGPAGLAAANRLNAMGYEVTVFEKDEYVGGLLRFGIPNFKLNKAVIDRRTAIMEAEGVRFCVNTPIDTQNLPDGFDAWCLCTGTPQARDLDIPGRELKGIHFALEMLSQQAGCGVGDADRDNAETAGRAQSGYSMAAVAAGAEDQLEPRGGLRTPLVSCLDTLRRDGGRTGERCGSGGGGVDSCLRRRTPGDETHGQEGNDRRRHGASGNGIPQTAASRICRQRVRGGRRGYRSKPRGEMHSGRTESRSGHRQLS